MEFMGHGVRELEGALGTFEVIKGGDTEDQRGEGLEDIMLGQCWN